jgi:uncharacterized membrane protein
MNVLQKLKVFWISLKEGKNLFKGGITMKALISSMAGWIKIITYAASIAGLLMGYIDAKLALEISLIVSAIVKIAQEIVKVTPNTKDNDFVNAVEKILKDKNIIKG